MEKLTLADFEAAAKKLGSSVAAVRAVADVESNGAGFLPDGRPKILFERHVFYRLLAKAGKDAKTASIGRPDIINQTPGGYQGGAAEWLRLTRAQAIDPDLAIEATSWGAFQVMGYHWRKLGYDNALDFQAGMMSDEATHLRAFVLFIAADPALCRSLRAKDWSAFARAYNGPNYKQNRYDEKMAAAYRRYAGSSA